MKNPLRTRLKELMRPDLPDGESGEAVTIPYWADNRIQDPIGRDFLRFLIKKEAYVLGITGQPEIVIKSGELAQEVGISKSKLRELILCFIDWNIISYQAPEGSQKMTIKLNDIQVWFIKG